LRFLLGLILGLAAGYTVASSMSNSQGFLARFMNDPSAD
jgi:hypothetical protein